MIKVYVSEPWSDLFGLKVFVIDRHEGGPSRIFRPGGRGVMSWDGLPEDSREVEPSFTLPEDTGRALLEALVRHYQGAEDTRMLRQDYNAERKRVDGLINALGDVVKQLAVEHA